MTLSNSASDVLIALRSGVGYRFDERLIRREGTRGIQTLPDDTVVGIVSVSSDDDEVLLVTAHGQGTRRQMAGFSANKTPGGQGKVLMKTEALVGIAQPPKATKPGASAALPRSSASRRLRCLPRVAQSRA